MIATSFNLAIALVEERPGDAREMLRALPLEESKRMPDLQHRLGKAVGTVVAREVSTALKGILMDCLRIHYEGTDPDYNEAFLEGVATVERIIEDRLVSDNDDDEDCL